MYVFIVAFDRFVFFKYFIGVLPELQVATYISRHKMHKDCPSQVIDQPQILVVTSKHYIWFMIYCGES